jgi:cob(I)alamin adenosyltransferase
MKLTGRVVFRDIETGVWVLEGDDGRTYQLAGGDRKIKKDGQRIEVEGSVDRAAMTIHMVGPVFNVEAYRFL